MDDLNLEEVWKQFFKEYIELKKEYSLLLRTKAVEGLATIEIYRVTASEHKRIIKVEEETQENAFRAGIREIARFKALQKHKREKEKQN